MNTDTQIEIWSIHLLSCDNEIEYRYTLLSDEEKNRAQSFSNKRASDQFVLSHSLLRQILAKKINTTPKSLVFKKNVNGKPFLADRKVEFNISHSRDRLLIAISPTKAVGIDIEFKRKNINMEAIAKRYFSKSEYSFLKSSQNLQDSFFDLWSRKEAYVKALGSGVFKDFAKLEVPLEIPSLGKCGDWFFQPLKIDSSYASCLVYKAPETNFTIRTYEQSL